jgi:hypothetical protein
LKSLSALGGYVGVQLDLLGSHHAMSLLSVLLDDDGIGALRHRRPGEDAHGFAFSDLAIEACAGCRTPRST